LYLIAIDERLKTTAISPMQAMFPNKYSFSQVNVLSKQFASKRYVLRVKSSAKLVDVIYIIKLTKT